MHVCTQVARNANESDSPEPTDAEKAQAENLALAALSDAFADLFTNTINTDTADMAATGTHITGSIFGHTNDSTTKSEGYQLVVDGDDLARAASGLSTGAVRAGRGGSGKAAGRGGVAGGAASGRPRSPTSPLDLAAPPAADAADAELASHPSEEMAGGDVCVGPSAAEWYLPGGVLDVDCVEKHMISIMQVCMSFIIILPVAPCQAESYKHLLDACVGLLGHAACMMPDCLMCVCVCVCVCVYRYPVPTGFRSQISQS